MTVSFRRLTRATAAATALFYISAFVLPAGLGAAPLPTATPTAQAPEKEPVYPPLTIGPGDILTITVLGYDRSIGGSTGTPSSSTSLLPVTYLVDSDGKILFPFVGQVALENLSQIDASKLLMQKLRGYLKYPQVTVVITDSNSYNVSVLGDVTRPGQFMIRGKPDILAMVAQAGGPGPDPDLEGVLITRGTEKINVDLGKYLTDRNYHRIAPTVYPGDVVYVPPSPWPSQRDISIFLGVIITSVVAIDAFSKK
jgi:protein involved in polysaccharide export with SLBB domain